MCCSLHSANRLPADFDNLTTARFNADLDNHISYVQYIQEPLALGEPTSISIHKASQRVAVTWISGSPNRGVAILPTDQLDTDASGMFLQFFRSQPPGVLTEVCRAKYYSRSGSFARSGS